MRGERVFSIKKKEPIGKISRISFFIHVSSLCRMKDSFFFLFHVIGWLLDQGFIENITLSRDKFFGFSF
jgi:hypothetical protein